MPLYTWECPKCGKTEEGFRSVADRHDSPTCHRKPMTLLILPTQVYVDMPAYVSPASGRRITTRAERKADLAATNSRPWEGMDSERREANKRKAETEAKLDAKVDATARKLFHQLPADQRRALETP